MTQKWNLQDIRPVESKHRRLPLQNQGARRTGGGSRKRSTEPADNNDEYEPLPSITITDGKKKNNKQIFAAIIIFIFVIF